jgi:hypothetical protein
MIKLFMMFKKNTYQPIQDLKNYPSQYSVLPLQYIHYIDKEEDFNPQELEKYLKQHSHQDIVIKNIKTTIEDVFMDLTNLNQ